jgi:hypothetical protein
MDLILYVLTHVFSGPIASDAQALSIFRGLFLFWFWRVIISWMFFGLRGQIREKILIRRHARAQRCR